MQTTTRSRWRVVAGGERKEVCILPRLFWTILETLHQVYPSDNLEATTWKRQLGSDNLEATTWKRQLGSDNSEATTRKRQLGSDNSEATTRKRQLGSDNSEATTRKRQLGNILRGGGGGVKKLKI